MERRCVVYPTAGEGIGSSFASVIDSKPSLSSKDAPKVYNVSMPKSMLCSTVNVGCRGWWVIPGKLASPKLLMLRVLSARSDVAMGNDLGPPPLLHLPLLVVVGKIRFKWNDLKRRLKITGSGRSLS